MNNEQEIINRFGLDGNVGNIGVCINSNGKKVLKFDLCQNNNNEYIPITLRGKAVDAYMNDIKKGNWVMVIGKITSFITVFDKVEKVFKKEIADFLSYEIIDRTNQKVYTYDGKIHHFSNKAKDKLERTL